MYVKITPEQIRAIHDEELQQSGGLSGMKDPEYLELIADKPFTDYFGSEQYPGLFLKAAVYFHGLATVHCFSEGNKRTAVIVGYTFLAANGVELNADEEELFSVAIQVAIKRMSLEDLARWLERNSIRS